MELVGPGGRRHFLLFEELSEEMTKEEGAWQPELP